MSRSNEAGHFFQTSSALETTARKEAKATNNHGKPLALPSKILAVHPDQSNEDAVYVAEAAGSVKRVVLDVGEHAGACMKYFEHRLLTSSRNRQMTCEKSTRKAPHP